MKLYATVTSERASKGQGGNEFLEIVIMNEEKEQQARFDVTNDENGFILDYLDYATGEVTRLKRGANTTHGTASRIETKGKKQKGEEYERELKREERRGYPKGFK